ncbi:hypothetical protein ACODRN_04865 [Leuconostoc mesenteroides]|uniref:hypothetical protein n=1 Tax=Leuconostoc mesenteroides TaxID=1245 RepID=UPI003B5106ED
MANEITIIDDFGQKFGLSIMTDDTQLKQLDNATFEDLVYLIKYLKNGIKKTDAELKSRLDNGAQFKHISYGESSKQELPADDNKVKQAFYNKYGLDALVVKSPTQLKKQFGATIQEDLDKVVIHKTQNRVNYD